MNISDQNEFNIPSRREDSSYYTLQKMNQLHHEIVRRIVVGQKDKEIADSLGITQATVKYVKESPIVKQKLDIMMGARDASSIELQKQIQALAPLALHEMSKMMIDDSAPHGVRSQISRDILDRAGFKPANVNINKDESYSEEQIAKIKERARAAGIMFDAEDAEDAEIIDEDGIGASTGATESQESNTNGGANHSNGREKGLGESGSAGEQPDSGHEPSNPSSF